MYDFDPGYDGGGQNLGELLKSKDTFESTVEVIKWSIVGGGMLGWSVHGVVDCWERLSLEDLFSLGCGLPGQSMCCRG